ncbi:transcription factor MYB56-like [Salvia hispanica]|uniref:transcription factor MYB56-like n=1 Tax=Salvia hispanica TaxID=49212 RepID=UPI0020091859|nr:transcription factor MYB56-like [Salvia hispanica]XP_047978202.1 transcription factor MYB56-like [Salvia hispanica]
MATLRTSGGASLSKKTCRRWHWTQEEDDLLTSLVQMHGPGKWDQIATHIPGRSGKSCRIRWLNQLHPGVDKKPFSIEEKQRLLVLHRKLGNKWAVIVHYFPGRTDNQVKNQYHILAGTRKSAPFPSRNDPHVPLDNESRGLFQNQCISMVDSDFSDVTSQGTNYHGSAPMVNVMPGLISSSSSVYGMGGYFTQVGAAIPSGLGPLPSYGNSMTSDANSAGVGGYEFMDFFRVGLGSSD